MAIRRFNVAVTGVSPLLLSNNMCSDPLSDANKQKKFFTDKGKKSDDDHQCLRLIDWIHSGYWSKPGEVLIDEVENTVNFIGFSHLTLPSQNFARSLRNGATAFRLGKETTKALIVENEPLINYDGPKEASEMIKEGRFVLTSPVVRQGKTNWITRIVLPEWSVEYQVTVDDDRISVENLNRICHSAGRFEGLGTWRGRYGRYTSEMEEID